jgi:hypothetical protein
MARAEQPPPLQPASAHGVAAVVPEVLDGLEGEKTVVHDADITASRDRGEAASRKNAGTRRTRRKRRKRRAWGSA